MTQAKRNEEFNKIKASIYDIMLNEENFMGKEFEIPITSKMSKSDREAIEQDIYLNIEYVELIRSNSNLFFGTFKNYSSEELIKIITENSYFREKLLPSNHIEDEEQSVRWNREYVEEFNKNVKERKLKHTKFINLLDNIYEDTFINESIEDNSIFKDIPKEVFKILYRKAYEDGHSYGFNEVRNYFYDELSTFEDILKVLNENKK